VSSIDCNTSDAEAGRCRGTSSRRTIQEFLEEPSGNVFDGTSYKYNLNRFYV